MMTGKFKLSHRVLSILLCAALVFTWLPLAALQTQAADPASPFDRAVDESTMNDWQTFFPRTGNITTENAGGIWTDKSVFDQSPFPDISFTDKGDNFLVALSAMGSNMTVTGKASAPIDTMFVLDVSGSMENDASSLVSATNAALTELLKVEGSRVGIVLFAGSQRYSANGSASVVLLPLGSYQTGADNQYIQLSNGTISLDRDVVIKGTNTRPSTTSKSVSNATYTQKGVMEAVNQFTAASNVLDSEESRKPVLVVMTDGDPTLGSVDFTDPQSPQFGTGGASSAALGFVNQLTLSYAKQQIQNKYKIKPLLYTLGLGTDGNAVSTNVLNPDKAPANNDTTTAINEYWTSYTTGTGTTVSLGEVRYVSSYSNMFGAQMSTRNDLNVTKVAGLDRSYVDRYFAANQGSDLAAAFQSIVAEIALQSKYYPTLVQGSENLSGYVSFVDKIGQYMEVTDVKGIRIHEDLFSGAELSKNFAPDANGGNLGTITDPKPLGDELVWAVQQRLGLADTATARDLIAAAYQYGQLRYTSDTDFSNYIGWCADASGNYLGFWHEGMDDAAIPAGTAFTVKSYGYLGEPDVAHGVAESDMMYATVQVRTVYDESKTADNDLRGDQQVIFSIPAALLPTVTYEVTLDQNSSLTGLAVTGADAPHASGV